MEQEINNITTFDKGPISRDAWEELREKIISTGGQFIQIGLLDDVDPNGGANIACQGDLEKAESLGQVIRVTTEISRGIRIVKSFRIINPRLSNQSESSFEPNSRI